MGQTLEFTKLGSLNQTSIKLEGGNEISIQASNGIQFHTTSDSLMIIGSDQKGVFSTKTGLSVIFKEMLPPMISSLDRINWTTKQEEMTKLE